MSELVTIRPVDMERAGRELLAGLEALMLSLAEQEAAKLVSTKLTLYRFTV